MEMTQHSFVVCHRHQIMWFVLLFFYFLGGNAAPDLHSHVSAAEVSVKLPSVNTDNETQSSIRGDSESSGTDTF